MSSGSENSLLTPGASKKRKHWQANSSSNLCSICSRKFTLLKRRHHCRRCGALVCGKCSQATRLDRVLGDFVRVCDRCLECEYEVVVRSRPFGSTFASSVSPHKLRATYVVNVKPGLSAHQGGLKEGSRLVEIDGKNVEGQPFKVIRKKIAESKLPFVLKVAYIKDEPDFVKLRKLGRRKTLKKQAAISSSGRMDSSQLQLEQNDTISSVQTEPKSPKYYESSADEDESSVAHYYSLIWLVLFFITFILPLFKEFFHILIPGLAIFPALTYFEIITLPKLEDRKKEKLEEKCTKKPKAREIPASDEGAEALKTGDDEIVEEKPMQQLSVEVMQPGNIKSEPWGGWGLSDASTVKVRGPNYLVDRIKIPSEDCILPLAHVDFLRMDPELMQHWCSHPSSWVQRNMEKLKKDNCTALVINMRFESSGILLNMNFLVPNDGPSPIPPRLQGTVKKFMSDQTCEFRDARLKMVPRIIEGPWLFKNAVPSGAVIVQKNIPTTYFEGPNYLEASLQPEVNRFAAYLIDQAKGIAKKLVVGLNFLLESQLQEELPERILAGCQLRYVDFSQANVPPEPQPVSLEHSINYEQEKDDEPAITPQ